MGKLSLDKEHAIAQVLRHHWKISGRNWIPRVTLLFFSIGWFRWICQQRKGREKQMRMSGINCLSHCCCERGPSWAEKSSSSNIISSVKVISLALGTESQKCLVQSIIVECLGGKMARRVAFRATNCRRRIFCSFQSEPESERLNGPIVVFSSPASSFDQLMSAATPNRRQSELEQLPRWHGNLCTRLEPW